MIIGSTVSFCFVIRHSRINTEKIGVFKYVTVELFSLTSQMSEHWLVWIGFTF